MPATTFGLRPVFICPSESAKGQAMSESAVLERTETAATETATAKATEAVGAEDLEVDASKTETTDVTQAEDEDEDPVVAEKVAAKIAQLEEKREADRIETERVNREAKAKKDVKDLYDTTAASLPTVIAPLLKDVPLVYTDDEGVAHHLTFTAGQALVSAIAEAVKGKSLDGFNLKAREHHSTLDHAEAVESALSLFSPAERDDVREKLADVKVAGLPQAIKELWTPKTLDEAVKRFPHLAPQKTAFGKAEYDKGRANPKPAGEGKGAGGASTGAKMTLTEIDNEPNNVWMARPPEERQRLLAEARAL